MRNDRLNPERTDRDFRRILELVIEVRLAWEEAVDVGVWMPRADGGRGSLDRATLADRNPVLAAARSPMQRQVRDAAKQAAELVDEARGRLQLASDVLHAAILRTDPEVLERFLEKRSAALG